MSVVRNKLKWELTKFEDETPFLFAKINEKEFFYIFQKSLYSVDDDILDTNYFLVKNELLNCIGIFGNIFNAFKAAQEVFDKEL